MYAITLTFGRIADYFRVEAELRDKWGHPEECGILPAAPMNFCAWHGAPHYEVYVERVPNSYSVDCIPADDCVVIKIKNPDEEVQALDRLSKKQRAAVKSDM
jgi:hypothetical protein